MLKTKYVALTIVGAAFAASVDSLLVLGLVTVGIIGLYVLEDVQ